MARLERHLAAISCGLLLHFAAGVARSEVVVVVSTESAVESLTRQQIADIYLGRLKRLESRGPVTPIDQREASPTYETFYARYLGRSAAQMKAHWSKLIFTGRGRPPRALRNGNAVADFVRKRPNAIGYIDRSLVDERLRVVRIE